MHMLIVIFLLFQVRFNSITKKSLKIVQHVDVAIKSYVISILTGSTFDGFIDCTTTNISIGSTRILSIKNGFSPLNTPLLVSLW